MSFRVWWVHRTSPAGRLFEASVWLQKVSTAVSRRRISGSCQKLHALTVITHHMWHVTAQIQPLWLSMAWSTLCISHL